MEREKRKEEIEKDYLKVKRYLIEDEKPPKYTSVIKNIELYLKSIKSQQSTFKRMDIIFSTRKINICR